MNREIKFRAWDKNIEAMVDPENLCLDGSGLVAIYYRNCDDEESGWMNEVQDIELMQYTGLKDKNGKEAYEGDLYYFSRFSDKPAEIYWDDRWWGWRGRVDGEMQSDKTYDISPLKFGEIIGNIYEYKELLEQ